MNTELKSVDSTLDDITERLCFYAIIGTYYVPAYAFRVLRKGVNFIDRQANHFVD